MILKNIVIGFFCVMAIALCGNGLAAGKANAAQGTLALNRDLAFGSVGEDVKNLQKFLNGNEYIVAISGAGSPGNETAYFGGATRAALSRFQLAHGLPAYGYVESSTRALLAGNPAAPGQTASLLARIEILKERISELQRLLAELLAGATAGNPYIASISVSNGGAPYYIDTGDGIKITFSEPVDPQSINKNLAKGGAVTGVTSSQTGGVSVNSSGIVTVQGIVKFDAGMVNDRESFTAKLELNGNGKILTITLTGGARVEIIHEKFTNASQTGGIIKDISGNKMQDESNIGNPRGAFGDSGDGDDNNNDGTGSNPYIVSITAVNGGDKGYIDTGDLVKITFSEEIDPKSINANLKKGSSVSGVSSYQAGGFSVNESGVVTISGVASFDMGEVAVSGTFTAKAALDSAGKTLTVTLASGSDFKITREDFENAFQIGGTVKDAGGNAMENDASINDPTGTFGGEIITAGNPRIISIAIADGGDIDYIDSGDSIAITFSEAIDPQSINSSLNKGNSVADISSSQIAGFGVTATGAAMVNGIANFDAGSVANSGSFVSKIALNSTGKILTVTLTGGSDIGITEEDFANAAQIGGAVKDLDGNTMDGVSNIGKPTGTFGGRNNDDDDNPVIESIAVSNGNDNDYIDKGDIIRITFSEPINPESINASLDEGGAVASIGASETGGISVDSAGTVIINNIAEFGAGSVNSSKSFTIGLALSSNAEVLTITLTGSDELEIENQELEYASQTGGTIEDKNGNKMEAFSNIGDPAGNF